MNYIKFLNIIKNAYLKKQTFIYTYANKFNYNLAKILKFYKYINKIKIIYFKNKYFLFLDLNNKYWNQILGIKFIINNNYFKFKHLNKLNNYYGLYLLTTSKGLLSLALAKKLKIGGKLICYIW
uniref:30S ribosomal protein S8 n=1 Tax=Nephromyces sp. ex Molgula occidentalis TaxID=2544991 RepID=A0A5C1H908_9APIC|nr:30S ribosomal protein S8 [Nephromyces sp. ex Molgula occidentalis]